MSYNVLCAYIYIEGYMGDVAGAVAQINDI